jgi:hypothetical protein
MILAWKITSTKQRTSYKNIESKQLQGKNPHSGKDIRGRCINNQKLMAKIHTA